MTGGSRRIRKPPTKNASTNVMPCVTKIPDLGPSPDFQHLPHYQLQVDPRSSRSLPSRGVPNNLKPQLDEEKLNHTQVGETGSLQGVRSSTRMSNLIADGGNVFRHQNRKGQPVA